MLNTADITHNITVRAMPFDLTNLIYIYSRCRSTMAKNRIIYFYTLHLYCHDDLRSLSIIQSHKESLKYSTEKKNDLLQYVKRNASYD